MPDPAEPPAEARAPSAPSQEAAQPAEARDVALAGDHGSAPPAVIQEGPGALLHALVGLAQQPNVNPETVAAWAAIQERMETREAERQFNAALMRLPPIHVKKNGTINLVTKEGVNKGALPFARWEDISRVIEPLLEAEGFRLTFDSQPRPGEGGGLIVTGTLLHRGGHSRSASMPLALDTGAGRNNVQAMGSSLAYGKRYTTEMLLNIVRDGEDDDGKRGGTKFITNEQVDELHAMLREAKRQECPMLDQMFGGTIRSVDELEAGSAGYLAFRNTLARLVQTQKKAAT